MEDNLKKNGSVAITSNILKVIFHVFHLLHSRIFFSNYVIGKAGSKDLLHHSAIFPELLVHIISEVLQSEFKRFLALFFYNNMFGGDKVKQKLFRINPVLANVPNLYPLKTPEKLSFLVFSGGVNRNIGQKWVNLELHRIIFTELFSSNGTVSLHASLVGVLHQGCLG